MSWADRIAYVCHDFEDAVSAGVAKPEELPAIVAERGGAKRGQQLGSFINAMIRTMRATGVVGMDAHHAEALAAFRHFNYETIYLRDASRQQASTVVAMLRALVEYFAEHPQIIPDVAERGGEVDIFVGSSFRSRRLRCGYDRPLSRADVRSPCSTGPLTGYRAASIAKGPFLDQDVAKTRKKVTKGVTMSRHTAVHVSLAIDVRCSPDVQSREHTRSAVRRSESLPRRCVSRPTFVPSRPLADCRGSATRLVRSQLTQSRSTSLA